MRPFMEENWRVWEEKDFSSRGLFRDRPDKEKDKWLLTYLAVYGRGHVQKMAMHILNISEIPELRVNPDDVYDEQYVPYLVLREQVMRESDYWVLKKAAFHAPRLMARFAFCRLTGCSWIPEWDDAYSYRTYSCGLKSDVSRDDIEDLCREMIDQKGPFQRNASRWLKELADIPDEKLAEMASERTERSLDREPEEVLRRLMRPLDGYSEEADLKRRICSVFDAYIMWVYTKHYLRGSGVLKREAMNDNLSDYLETRFEYTQEPSGNILTAIEETLAAGGRSALDMTTEKIREIAWNVCEDSPEHSFFLYLAYWYGFKTKENDDLALKMLMDAAQRGHLRSYDSIVQIYSEGEYVHKNMRLALTWQEKKVEHYRLLYEKHGYLGDKRAYSEALRELGDLLMKDGHARQAKQYYRKADQLAD